MGKRIFKNEEHQALFDKQGFIVLPFISDEEVKILDAFFDEMHPHLNQKGFFSGSYSSDFEYKKKASDGIVQIFAPHYEKLFADYTPFGAAFLCKMPGHNSSLAAHQDWTIVNENENVALNCWVPLCDISLENGPIMIMPGSQYENSKALRAPTLPFFFSGNEDVVHAQLEPMIVKAGTAVILNQSVIHFSPNNSTDKIRKAITAGIKSAGAQMVFHYKVPDKDELEIFEQDDDFLIRFDNFFQDIGERPKNGKSIGFMPFEMPVFTRDELVNNISEMKKKAGFEVYSFPLVDTLVTMEGKNISMNENITSEKKSIFKKIAGLFGV